MELVLALRAAAGFCWGGGQPPSVDSLAQGTKENLEPEQVDAE